MPYSSQAAVLGYISLMDLISLTDDSPSTGNVNTTVLNQCIANVSAEIDAMLGSIRAAVFLPDVNSLFTSSFESRNSIACGVHET